MWGLPVENLERKWKKKDFKYFIVYKNGKKSKPLYINLSYMDGFVNIYK